MTYQSPNWLRSTLRIASAGSVSSSSSVWSRSEDAAGAASGSAVRLAGAPPSTSGTTSATPVRASWSAVSTEPSAAPISPAPVSTSVVPRTSKRASSSSVASTALSVSKGSRGSVTVSLPWSVVQARAGSAEDGEHALGEEEVQAGHQRDDEGHEDDDDGRVRDQLTTSGPDDLAQLGDDLAEEAPEAA